MPAPLRKVIEENLKQAYLAQGFAKYEYINGVLTQVPGELPEALMKVIKANADGIARTWEQWQATQAIVIPVTAPQGSPSIGKPPFGGLLP
jgi:hypothetical protein